MQSNKIHLYAEYKSEAPNTNHTQCKFEKNEWWQWQEQTIVLSDCDSEYRCDERSRSWKSDCKEGMDATLNRKNPYLSGNLYMKNCSAQYTEAISYNVYSSVMREQQL